MNIPVFNSVLTTASQDSVMKIKKTKSLMGVRKRMLMYDIKLT